uniref:Uncharacterized protein n=1 Tax=Arundo donax TaxID=35708 RepID=A0A0A8ZFY0_ARUDO
MVHACYLDIGFIFCHVMYPSCIIFFHADGRTGWTMIQNCGEHAWCALDKYGVVDRLGCCSERLGICPIQQ